VSVSHKHLFIKECVGTVQPARSILQIAAPDGSAAKHCSFVAALARVYDEPGQRGGPMRSSSIVVAVFVGLGLSYALAQGGGLAGVTMRVVEDLSGSDAVVLELDPPAENTDNTENTDEAERPAAKEGEPDDASDGSESVERAAPQPQA
jgi:hypothetical protein